VGIDSHRESPLEADTWAHQSRCAGKEAEATERRARGPTARSAWGSTANATVCARPTRERIRRAARARRPRRRSVLRGPAQWGIETRASTAPPCPGGYRRTC